MQDSFFIKRPVLSTVISIFIILLGSLALSILPIAQYPELIPPIVEVKTSYPGASPEVIASTVATPIEEAINGVDGMIYMQSTSNGNGDLVISVTFEIGTDAELAMVNVNNRVQSVLNSIPAEARTQGVTVSKLSPAMLQVVTLQSPDGLYDDIYLSNYAILNVQDEIKRIPGVGSFQFFGAKDYAMRIWLKPELLSAYSLSTNDIAAAVREQNAQYAAGRLGLQPASDEVSMTWQLITQGRLSTPEEFGNIILRSDSDGGALRLKDVARIEMGAMDYNFSGKLNGMPITAMAIYLAPGANALKVADDVSATMQKLSESFPHGLTYEIPYDTTTFVRISIDEVFKTLLEAMVLVFLVVYLFLQNIRSTLIPCLAVPVSIIGTFAGMYLLGFTVNTLTLFGLVLAIGIVVDDAIVVLENVERIMRDEKLPVREATNKAIKEVTGPVITIVLVLCSVFIPVAFLGGFAGEMYRQFAVTISLSVVISGIVALSFTPALCILLIKDIEHKPNAFFRAFNRGFDKFSSGFGAITKRFTKSSALSLGFYLILILATAFLLKIVPIGLVPEEDQGYILALAVLPDGASLSRTEAVTNSLSAALEADPSVSKVVALSGIDALSGSLMSNYSTLFIIMKPWSERTAPGMSSYDLVNKTYGIGMGLTDAQILAFNPPPIMGLSNTGGFEMWLQDRAGYGSKALSDTTREFVALASQQKELSGVSTTFSVNTPQLYLELDREKARALNVSVSSVFSTLSATMGASYINDFTAFGRSYKVFMQAESNYRENVNDLRYLHVRSEDGKMIPLLGLVNSKLDSGPPNIVRFNSYPSAKVMGSPAANYSSGQALATVSELAKSLPTGYGIAWTGSAYQELEGGGTNYMVLLLSLIMVFLILAAQYESWSIPISVLSAIPFAVFGALLANYLRGYANDIYMQVAIITLMGLAAKNAVLIVEFAAVGYKNGLSATEAALEAAHLRLRPIIMTSLAFILGCVPLAISSGAGAASRHAIGTSVIGGMLVATLVAPLLVPYFFRIIAELKERFFDNKTNQKNQAHLSINENDAENAEDNAEDNAKGNEKD